MQTTYTATGSKGSTYTVTARAELYAAQAAQAHFAALGTGEFLAELRWVTAKTRKLVVRAYGKPVPYVVGYKGA